MMLEKLIADIESEPPFGEDLKYDVSFEKVKGQFTGTNKVDLDLVRELSIDLLCNKSKDIRLFSFLLFASIKSGEWKEMANSVEALTTLSEKDFKSLYPKRSHAKQLALKWLSEARFTRSLDIKITDSNNYNDFKRSRESLEKIKAVLEDEYTDGAPFPYSFYEAIKRWERESKPADKPKSVEATTTASSTSNSSTETATTPQVQASVGTIELTNSKVAIENCRKSAFYLIEQEPAKGYGYKLIRSARWGAIVKLPPADGGKTQLNAVRKEQLKVLENQISNSEFAQALMTSEKFFNSASNHYLLDLQFYSATAAMALGSMYTAIYDIICLETALLVKKYPAIVGFLFSDGTPFCNMETKKWIESSDVTGLFEQGKGPSGSTNLEDNSEEVAEVDKLIKAGKKEAAVELLETIIDKTGKDRSRIELYLRISEIVISLKKYDAALGILERLYEDGKKSSIEKWDSELATRIMVELSEIYKIIGAEVNGERKILIGNKRRELIRKIAYISPKNALKIG